jgi:hypothetical protein
MKKPSLRKFGTVVFLLGRLSVAVRRTLEFHRRNSMNCARLGGLARPKFSTAAKLFAIEALDEFFDALPDENHEAAEDWTATA